MASVRKRSWSHGGKTKTAWVADYFDQAGVRHLKTFSAKKAADAFLVETRHEVARGVHTADSVSITISEAAVFFRGRGSGARSSRSFALASRSMSWRHMLRMRRRLRYAQRRPILHSCMHFGF